MSDLTRIVGNMALAAIVTCLGIAAYGISPAAAQTTYSNCAALNGHSFVRTTHSTITNETLSVTLLADEDLISVSVTAFSGDDGDMSASVTVDGTQVFSDTYSGTGDFSGSATYDPPADSVDASITLDTDPWTDDEGQVTITISCTHGAGATDTPTDTTDTTDTSVPTTSNTSQAFLTERIRRLLEERPDRARYIRKRLKALWGSERTDGDALANSLTRQASVRSAPVRVASAADRDTPVLIGMAARDASLRAYAYTNGDVTEGCGVDEDGLPTLSCLDVWTEAHYTTFTDEGSREGRFAVGYAGIDAHVSPWAIVGLLAQMDWMTDDIGSASSRTESVGWMAGPYASMRLTPELFLDLRGAWGWSDTDITTLGTVGNFATERWLATAQLTGNFQWDVFRISPEVSVEYIEEVIDDFQLATGTTIGSQRVSIGRVRFGPEIATLVPISDGVMIEPRVALRGIWDFDPAETVTLGAVTYNDETLRGVFEAGAILHGLDGFNIAISGKYDGIGINGFDAYGGYIWINAPL